VHGRIVAQSLGGHKKSIRSRAKAFDRAKHITLAAKLHAEMRLCDRTAIEARRSAAFTGRVQWRGSVLRSCLPLVYQRQKWKRLMWEYVQTLLLGATVVFKSHFKSEYATVDGRTNITSLSVGERDPCDLAPLDHRVCPHKKMIPGPVFLFALTWSAGRCASYACGGCHCASTCRSLTRERAA
jgi:hypothetical protein